MPLGKDHKCSAATSACHQVTCITGSLVVRLSNGSLCTGICDPPVSDLDQILAGRHPRHVNLGFVGAAKRGLEIVLGVVQTGNKFFVNCRARHARIAGNGNQRRGPISQSCTSVDLWEQDEWWIRSRGRQWMAWLWRERGGYLSLMGQHQPKSPTLSMPLSKSRNRFADLMSR